MRLRNLLLASAFVLSGVTLAHAQTAFSVNYNFTGATGSQASTAITADVPGALTFSPFTRGSGITATAAGGSISSTAFVVNGTLADAIAQNEYYTFTVTPTANVSSFSIADFSFGTQRSGTGPQNFVVRSSADNFATDLTPATAIPTTNAINTITPTNSTNLTGATEFRLYGYGATGAGGTWRIGTSPSNGNQFIIDGSYQPVPAPPAAISLGIGGVVGLLGTGVRNLRARRQAKRKEAAK